MNISVLVNVTVHIKCICLHSYSDYFWHPFSSQIILKTRSTYFDLFSMSSVNVIHIRSLLTLMWVEQLVLSVFMEELVIT